MLRTVTGWILVVAGTIWILQGFDVAFAPESFMTDSRIWVVWGILAVGSGVWAIRGSRGSEE